MCFHLAKHLNSTGAGIRMVMDLALFLKAYQDTLERYPVLLPAAWIKRWRLGLQNRWKMKAAFKGIDQSESLEEAKMQYRLLKKIGL